MDFPWEESAEENTTREVAWTKISSEFTNVGYREGITAGKEGALQEGFDAGFGEVGVPVGHQLGFLRGLASGLHSYLKSETSMDGIEALAEIRQIIASISKVRFSDIMPPDLEAEEHARQHLEQEGEAMDQNEDIAKKRDMEKIEDMFASLSAGAGSGERARPNMQDLHRLSQELKAICARLNFGVESWPF